MSAEVGVSSFARDLKNARFHVDQMHTIFNDRKYSIDAVGSGQVIR